jgi:hypothetical protein
MLSKKEHEELIKTLEDKEPKSIEVKVFMAIVKNMNLNIDTIDPAAKEVMEMSAEEIVAIKSFDKLNTLLLGLNKMRIYVQSDINRKDIYVTALKIEYEKELFIELEKNKTKNLLRNEKSDSAKEKRLLLYNKDLAKRKIIIRVLDKYVQSLSKYIDLLEEKGNSLKRIIDKRKMEYEIEIRQRGIPK